MWGALGLSRINLYNLENKGIMLTHSWHRCRLGALQLSSDLSILRNKRSLPPVRKPCKMRNVLHWSLFQVTDLTEKASMAQEEKPRLGALTTGWKSSHLEQSPGSHHCQLHQFCVHCQGVGKKAKLILNVILSPVSTQCVSSALKVTSTERILRLPKN